jgi:radical SAM superfamily enzyme YgiQ (UPF0313 family)
VREWANEEAEVLDAEALRLSTDDIVRHVVAGKYDLVGVAMLTPLYLHSVKTFEAIKKALPHIPTVVGGAHATIMAEETLQANNTIDYAVVGEGEETIVDLVAVIKGNKKVEEVPGLVYRNGVEIVRNPDRKVIMDVDSIPWPARDSLPMEHYRPTVSYYRRLPSYFVMAARGCPYRCHFCSQVIGKQTRIHSSERIIAEMEFLYSKYGAKEIVIEGDTLTYNKRKTMELCEEIIKSKLHKKLAWVASTRVNCVDEELLRVMKEAGCWQLSFGVESGVQRLVDHINKKISLEQVERVFKMAHRIGIETRAFFMLGLPTESYEDSLQTIAFAKRLKTYWAQFTVTIPYPGTALFEMAKKSGTLKSYNWEHYNSWSSWSDEQHELVHVPEGRTSTELLETQKYALRSFYLRPKILFNRLKELSWENYSKMFTGLLVLLKSKFKRPAYKHRDFQ